VDQLTCGVREELNHSGNGTVVELLVAENFQRARWRGADEERAVDGDLGGAGEVFGEIELQAHDGCLPWDLGASDIAADDGRSVFPGLAGAVLNIAILLFTHLMKMPVERPA